VEVRGYKETNNILDSLAREMSENLSKAQKIDHRNYQKGRKKMGQYNTALSGSW